MSFLLDGSIWAYLLSLVFGEEFTHNAVAEDSGVVDTLALGSWCIRAYRGLGSLFGRSVSSGGCLGFNIHLVGEGGQNQEDNDSVDDSEDDTIDEMVLDRASQEVVAVDKEGEGHFRLFVFSGGRKNAFICVVGKHFNFLELAVCFLLC